MKSYFNVPNHIDNTNRHLGIERNVRKNKYEPKAKKKHRIARLKFLNNKRNIEIFRMSINAMYEHIDLLNQFYHNLKILEEERIYNIELEKQKILEEAEKKKQQDLVNFQNTVSIMKEQLDLIPKYKLYIDQIINENKMIEEEKLMIDEMIKLEHNENLINNYRIYFDEIKRKEKNNTDLLEKLHQQHKQKNLYQSYIKRQNEFYNRYNSIYNNAIDINNNIINDKLRMQKTLDNWSEDINKYNQYKELQTDIINNYREEQELLKHEERIDEFKNRFTHLNNELLEIMKNIDNNKKSIEVLDDPLLNDIPEVDKIHINQTYINHFNNALNDMQRLQKMRIHKINDLKRIQKEQKEMIIQQERNKKKVYEKKIDDYKNFIQESRKQRTKMLKAHKQYLQDQDEIKKNKERIILENKSIKLKNEISKFTESIQQYSAEREKYINFKNDEALKLQEKRELEQIKIQEEEYIKAQNEIRKKKMDYYKTIETTVQNVYVKQIEKISEEYKQYQDEILKLEQQKEEELLIEKEKLEQLENQRKLRKQIFIDLEMQYNNLIKEEAQLKIEKEQQEQYEENIKNNMLLKLSNEVKARHEHKLLIAQIELQKKEEEIKRQEIIEYEKQVVFNNNIQYYSNLLIENKKAHEAFKKSIKEYKELELAELEKIKQEELFLKNKNIVDYSIEFILNNVDIEIETIEYNKTLESYNKDINAFRNSVIERKKELELIKEQQIKNAEYEKLQLELQEQQLMEYKKQQEEELITRMNDMLLLFNTNTTRHLKMIEQQKHEAELADIKKKEQERENIRLMKQKEQDEFNACISYFSNEINTYNNNVTEYKNKIDEYEKKIQEEKRLYELNKKKAEEEERKLKLQNQQTSINNFQQVINKYRDNINQIEKIKNEKKIALTKEKERLELEHINKQKEINDMYIKHYSSSIKITHKAYEDHIENQRLAKINYEKEQKTILENIEKAKQDTLDKLKNDYNVIINNINEQKSAIIKEKADKELAKKEYEKKQQKLLLEQEKNLKDQFNQLLTIYNNELLEIKDNYNSIKIKEQNYQKELEQKKINKRKEEEAKKLQEYEKIQSYFNKSITEMNNEKKKYKQQLDKYNDEQMLISKQQQFKLEEETRLREEAYNKSIIEYENSIKKYNDMVIQNKLNIEELKLQKEKEDLKIIEDNEKEKVRLHKQLIDKYELEINKFYDNQNAMLEQIHNDLKKEKEQQHLKRMTDLEKEIQLKMQSFEKDDVVKKLDNTINYIKDLNDNKENVDYINELKHQYDSSYINPDESQPVDDNDILYVGETKLSYDNFSIYNRYTFNVVPKIIYQTWPTKNLTKNMAWVVNRLRSTHPDFEYNLYDDNDCRFFIKEHFGNETLWAFDRLIPGAYKADLWRYCAMYITGGIYLDIKMCPVNGFRFDYLLKSDWYCNDIARGSGFAGIWQGILVSRPKNPIFKYLIEKVIENVKNEYYGDDPLEITGPKMMKILLNKLKVRVDTNLQIKKYLNKKASTIAKREYKVGICIDDVECLLEYDEYRQECLRTGVHYNAAWKNNEVYNKSVLLENYVSETV